MNNNWSYSSVDGSMLLSFAISFTIQMDLVPTNISEIINNHLMIDNDVDVSAFQPSCKYNVTITLCTFLHLIIILYAHSCFIIICHCLQQAVHVL